MNPEREQHVARLRSALDTSRERLRDARDRRLLFLQHYVGGQYGEDALPKQKVPVNFLELYVTTIVQRLASRPIETSISSKHQDLWVAAQNLQQAVNAQFESIPVSRVYAECVHEALFGMGIAKVGLQPTPGADPETDSGTPFVKTVLLEDWVHDMGAVRLGEAQFMGDCYEMRLDHARDFPGFEKRLREKLQAHSESPHDEFGTPRSKTLSAGERTTERLFDTVRLWDIYLPQDGLLITLPEHGTDVLRVVEVDDSCGPVYHTLGFGAVPGNILPPCPVQHVYELHDIINRMVVKLGRQAERQKTVLAARFQSAEDAKTIVAAEDGEAVHVDDPNGFAEMRFGGIDQVSLAYVLQLNQWFKEMAGNLDALAGLGPSAETLGQDQMIATTASGRMDAMESQAMEFAEGLARHVAHYVYTDPQKTYMLEKGPESARILVPYTPEQRQEPFVKFNFKIRASAMRRVSPTGEAQAIQQLIGQVFPMMAPYMEMQGVVPDAERILKLLADKLGVDAIGQTVSYIEPQRHAGPGPVQPQGGGKPPVTKRTYERVNRPGATRAGRESSLMGALLGSGLQQSQAESIGRGVS